MLASEVWSPAEPPSVAPDGIAHPRIAICGIAIEASTFSPHRTDDAAFTQSRGVAAVEINPFLQPGMPYREAAEWIGILKARSLPGGMVLPETYMRFKTEIVDGLRAAGPLDGVWFDIHGAMSVEGLDDAEGDLAGAVRDVVGPDPFVAASMDLHGNVSEQLVAKLDHLTCYRMAPHEDAPNTRMRLAHTLLSRLRGPGGADPDARRPWLARVPVPILLPGEKTSTRLEPATSLYQRVADIADTPGIVDASFWIGYAWADQPRSIATVIVSSDDAALAHDHAAALAREIWAERAGFSFVAPSAPLPDCLDLARRRVDELSGPYVISDSGDNPTAGGAGDVTYALHGVLTHPVSAEANVIMASVFDAAAVAACREAGVGAQIDLPEVAGRVDQTSPPVRLTGRVHSVTEGDAAAGTVAVIEVRRGRGTVFAIVTERRKPYHLLDDFRRLGLDPSACGVLVVKIGYLEPELYELAADWMLALTPGGVDQDLIRLGHRRISRPMFPFDADMADPDLTPRLHRR